MLKSGRLLLFVLLLPVILFGQQNVTLSGIVSDQKNKPLPGATLIVDNGRYATISNNKGYYKFSNIPRGVYEINIRYMGYENHMDNIDIYADTVIDFALNEVMQNLQEVVITDRSDEEAKRQQALNVEIVNEAYLKQNQGGSLAQSLERLPGVTTIGIGSSQAKPVIRGLSFNRIVVAQEGIQHEAQQWGADHGLEIDQYAVDKVELIKGPASLMYGSGAIGGVLEVKHNKIPAKNTIGGTVDLTGKTVNNYLGSSVFLYARKDKIFADFRTTLIDYADYKVPTDSIDIYSYKAALHNRQLRNTAGKEYDLHFSGGYITPGFQSRLYASNVYSKSGMFANAHGLEPRYVDTLLHDKSDRDINDPYQEVNHLKIISKNNWQWDNYKLETDLGFQHNFRQEWSKYTSHYYLPAVFPDTLGFSSYLERQFDKYVYSGNAKFSNDVSDNMMYSIGVNSGWQKNTIDGYGFIIPTFTQFNLGGFVYAKYSFTHKSNIQLGVRYDYGEINTSEYYDWFLSPIVESADSVWGYKKRASDLELDFQSVSWSAGYVYNTNHWMCKVNIGKGFRMPTAKELAANGINYHYFRYEIGDSSLSPESSYQLDLGIEYKAKRFALGLTPFVNYFSNYIYLNPTADYEGSSQKCYYTQSKVFRWGGEVHSHYQLLKSVQLGFVGEYIYSIQLSGEKEGYTLPFSPPASALFNVKFQRDLKPLYHAYFSVDYKITAAQESVVPPEEPTDGYQLVNIRFGGDVKLDKQEINISMQIQNLFDTKYFDHTSFYRLINVPGAGRNFVVNLTIPFQGKIKP